MIDRNWAEERLVKIKKLNASVDHLDINRVEESKRAIRDSYDESTLHQHLGRVITQTVLEKRGFRSICLRHLINVSNFNDPTYIWRPYFSDVGRAIANGEQKYIQRRIGQKVKFTTQSISRSHPQFSILCEEILSLANGGLGPDVLLAPKELHSSFISYFKSDLDWSSGYPGKLVIQSTRLKVFWSNKYAPLDSFIILNSDAAVWNIVPDPDSKHPLIVAIGESAEYDNKVEYWVETLASYKIIDYNYFRVIPLSGEFEHNQT